LSYAAKKVKDTVKGDLRGKGKIGRAKGRVAAKRSSGKRAARTKPTPAALAVSARSQNLTT